MSAPGWRRAYFTVLVLSGILIPLATVGSCFGTLVLYFELGRRGLDAPELLSLLISVHPWGVTGVGVVGLGTIAVAGFWRASHRSVVLSGVVLVLCMLFMWAVLWIGIAPYLAYTGNIE